MREIADPTRPAQLTTQASAASAAATQRGALAPVASMTSGYASIIGLVLLFSMSRIGRLTKAQGRVSDA